MPLPELFFFGPVRVKHVQQDGEINLSKAKALLAYLMVTARPHSRDVLATMLWPESDGSHARASLRRVLYYLNQTVGEDLLLATGDTIARNPDADLWLDVEVFREQVSTCLGGDVPLTEACLHELEEAVALCQDDFLSGFTLPDSPAFDEWQFFEREALHRDLARVLIRLAEAYAAGSDWEAAIGVTRRWLALDPLHEPAHRDLMKFYAHAGQQAAAVRQYEECERILNEELGVGPEAKTTALFEAIRTRQLGPTPVEPIPTDTRERKGSRRSALSTLPVDNTPFIGREEEVAEVTAQLSDPACRLLTLVGLGGAGKTRLAIAVARQVAPTFADGVTFVNLQPVQNADFLVTAIADALNFSLSGVHDPETQLLNYLRNRSLLLLLDNFEHLLAASSIALLKRILGAVPGVRLLLTSRTVLSLQEEWRYPVLGLPVPDSAAVDNLLAYGSVELFLERARRMRPDFSLAEERAGVVRICQLVEGMPLALELAASWLATLHPMAIAAEIQLHMDFLSTSLHDVPARHRSMQAVFERSWKMMDKEERQAFERLSVFRGGFRREAAQAVAGASLHTLSALVDKSLIRRDYQERYQIHELLRQYSAEKLAQTPAEESRVRHLHCTAFAAFLQQRDGDMNGSRQRVASSEIEAELDNIQAAWDWAAAQGRVDALQDAADALYLFYQFQSRYQEGAATLARAVEGLAQLPDSRPVQLTRAEVLVHYGWFHIRLGHLQRAQTALEKSLHLYQTLEVEPPARGMATDPRIALAILAALHGDYEESWRTGQQVRREAAARGDTGNLMFAHYVLTSAALTQGNFQEARDHGRRACRLAEGMGNRWIMAYFLNERGKVVQVMGEYERAEQYFRDSYAIRKEFSDPEGMAAALNHLAELALEQEKYEEAEELFQQSLALYEETGDRGGSATALNGLGQSAYFFQEYEAAGHYFRQALAIAGDIHFFPLTFSVLLNVAGLLLETGETREGLRVLDVVRHHYASDHATREKAQRQFDAYREHLTDDAFLPAQPEDGLQDLEALIQQLHLLLPTQKTVRKPPFGIS